MPIVSARRMSALASYRPEAAIPLSADTGRMRALGGRPDLGRFLVISGAKQTQIF
jgi:hypothetical protein